MRRAEMAERHSLPPRRHSKNAADVAVADLLDCS